VHDEKSRKSAQQIVDQSHRLSGMITELMAFAKPEAPKPVSSDVGEIIAGAVAEATARDGHADRKVEIAAFDVPAVRVDPQQVGSAIAEMLDNALQATEANMGHVSISAGLDPFGGKVVITITDEGVGMDEQTLRRAFDPFFSSKPAGRRRGMGLSKAQRWIDTAGGSVRLESRVARDGHPGGTRAILLLPVDPEAAGHPAASATKRAAG
jgi:signal transduction histidine kinase